MLKFGTKVKMEPVPSMSPGSSISSATEATINTPSAQLVDSALWPAHLSDVGRVKFVRQGPFKIVSDFTSIVEIGCSFDLFLLLKVVNLNGIGSGVAGVAWREWNGVPKLFHSKAPQTELTSGRGPTDNAKKYEEKHQPLKCMFLLLFTIQ